MRTTWVVTVSAALGCSLAHCSVAPLDVRGKTCASRADCPGSVCTRGVCEAPGDAAAGTDASTLSYYEQVRMDVPVVYLRLGEGAGPTAVDEMKHYDGTYSSSGVTYGVPGAIAGDPNTAVALDGAPLVGIAMPPCLDFAGVAPFSVEFWVSQTTSKLVEYVVDHDDWLEGRAGWDLYLGNGTAANIGGPTLERWNDAGTTAGSYATDPDAITQGVYHHIVGTFSGTELVLYVDAQVKNESSGVDVVPSTGISWLIGNCSGCGAGEGFVGSLDEVAIYDHALTMDRVVAHYRAAQ